MHQGFSIRHCDHMILFKIDFAGKTSGNHVYFWILICILTVTWLSCSKIPLICSCNAGTRDDTVQLCQPDANSRTHIVTARVHACVVARAGSHGQLHSHPPANVTEGRGGRRRCVGRRWWRAATDGRRRRRPRWKVPALAGLLLRPLHHSLADPAVQVPAEQRASVRRSQGQSPQIDMLVLVCSSRVEFWDGKCSVSRRFFSVLCSSKILSSQRTARCFLF